MLGGVIVGALLAAMLFPRFLRWVYGTAAERTLGQMCMGNKAQVKRLIEHEKQRRPGMSQQEAARRALDALMRDRR